jgi:hypothetical protein
MNVFFYSLEYKEKEKNIHQIMEQLLPSDQIEIYRSIKDLVQKLKKPLKEKPIVVVLINQREELLDMTSIRDQLYQVYLILILPDAEKETISLCHNLRPNYLTYAYRDIDELKAVLIKILKRS